MDRVIDVDVQTEYSLKNEEVKITITAEVKCNARLAIRHESLFNTIKEVCQLIDLKKDIFALKAIERLAVGAKKYNKREGGKR